MSSVDGASLRSSSRVRFGRNRLRFDGGRFRPGSRRLQSGDLRLRFGRFTSQGAGFFVGFPHIAAYAVKSFSQAGAHHYAKAHRSPVSHITLLFQRGIAGTVVRRRYRVVKAYAEDGKRQRDPEAAVGGVKLFSRSFRPAFRRRYFRVENNGVF